MLEIVDKEKPLGVIVQYGGQTPLKLALGLEAEGVPIIGTSPDMIDAAEDRERFQKLLHELKLLQPPNATARTEPEALEKAAALGYPLVVRPSYVLGGRAMEIVHEQRDLERYMREAVKVSHDSPVLLDRFLNDAIECDVDCLSDGKQTFIGGVMEHIEQAGVHSGDSACSLPPYSLSQGDHRRDEAPDRGHGAGPERGRPDERAVRDPGKGRQGRDLRAGGEPPRLAHRAVREQGHRHPAGQGGGALHGRPVAAIAGHHARRSTPPYFSVKEAVFPFVKFPGVDTILGPEMKSTGEVMGVGKTFGEAFIKSQLGAGTKLPRPTDPVRKVFLTVKNSDKPRAVEVARQLAAQGFLIAGTKGTAAAINAAGIACESVNKVTEGRPHVVDMIKNNEIVMVINTVEERRNAISDSRAIRTSSLLARVTTFTTIAGAEAAVEGMKYMDNLDVYSLQELHAQLGA